MLLEINNMGIYYEEMCAVEDVSLQVDVREDVCIIGSNGAGKSTLIKAISRIIPIKYGALVYKGERINDLPSHKIIELGIVQVPEGRRMFPFMSVFENLLVASHTKKAKEKRTKNLNEIFDLFPALRDKTEQFAGSLSGGEQQMVAMARGLMADPELLMLDEPSLGLAPMLVTTIFEIMRKIKEKEVTILIIEQNVAKALSEADRGYVLENGAIVIEGTRDELLNNEYLRKAYLGI
jgi:branched-chain amino acid transport system ATP-binding protein